ncbi:Uncharacterised protein [Vibrio cholerae]|uniref:Uncharacterized protein n=1 Tax=Vibrio cholerae TaxID=666 RepID=A0A656B0A4_VIBCL|nr:Uncharacterised protein [Vibrio cholerae]
MTHDGHDWRTGNFFELVITIRQNRFFQLIFLTQNHFVTHFFRYQLSSFLVNHLVNGRHRAHFHHHFDDFCRFH